MQKVCIFIYIEDFTKFFPYFEKRLLICNNKDKDK